MRVIKVLMFSSIVLALVIFALLNFPKKQTTSQASNPGTITLSSDTEWAEGTNSDTDLQTTVGSIKIAQHTTNSFTNLSPLSASGAIEQGGYGSDGTDIYTTNGLFTLEDPDGYEAFKYDVSENSWSQIANRVVKRGFTCGAGLNGKYYLMGGSKMFVNFMANVEAYDPSSNSWQQTTAMNNIRRKCVAKTVNNKIYVFGGTTLTSESFDGISWTNLAPMPAGLEYASAAYADGAIYIYKDTTAYKYDIALNSWTTLSAVPFNAETAFDLKGTVYVLSSIGEVYTYNTGTGQYTSLNLVNDNTSPPAYQPQFSTTIGDYSYIFRAWSYSPYPLYRFPLSYSYYNQAVHVSTATQLDSGDHNTVNWTTFVPDDDILSNTSVSYRFRTSANATDWSSWSASTPSSDSIDLSGLTQQRYLQVESTLASTNGVLTPTINSYTADYNYSDAPPPTCSDNTQNGDETGTDCGGSCEACPIPETCIDTIQNQNETGVDCGGVCSACPVVPTCFDGAQNQGEENVDCGGPCGACPVEPTCNDGIKNGSETDIDCGGSCGACEEPKLCQNNELQECRAAVETKYQQCLADAGGDPVIIQTCYSLPCTEDSACFVKCGLTGIDTSDDIHVIVPNGEEQYKLTEQMEIKWDFYQLKRKVLKDNYAIKFSLSTDSGQSYEEIKTLLPKNKSTSWISNSAPYDYYVVKNKNGATVNINSWPEVTEGYLSYTWEIPADTSLISNQVRIKLEPTGACTAGQGDASDRDFKISEPDKPILTLNVEPSFPKVSPNSEITFIAKAFYNNAEVTEATVFGFKLSEGGEIIAQEGNKATIKSGNEIQSFPASLSVTASYRTLTAESNVGFEIVETATPPPDEEDDPIAELLKEVKGFSANSALSLLIAALLSLAILGINSVGNVISVMQGGQLSALFAKGKDKKNAKGLVYDAFSGLPLPFVNLIITSNENSVSSIVRSDRDGKFAMPTNPGQVYSIKIDKYGYSLFSDNAQKTNNFLKYELKFSNNYFGEPFTAHANNYFFDKNIPLVPNADSVRLAQKTGRTNSFAKALIALNWIIILVGLTFSIMAIIYAPSTFNLIILCLYLLLFTFYLVKFFLMTGKSFGIIKSDGEAVPLAIVRVLRAKDSKLIRTVVSDREGKFGLALPKGYYKVYISKQDMKQEHDIDLMVRSGLKFSRLNITLKKIGAAVQDQVDSPSANVDESMLPAKTENTGYNAEAAETYPHFDQTITKDTLESSPRFEDAADDDEERYAHDASEIIENFR